VLYTTGVSSTTVASRLSTAVIAEAVANTWASSRRGRGAPCHPRPAGAEQALAVAELRQHEHGGEEADHRRQTLRLGQSGLRGDRPATVTSAAAGTATTASGQPRGRITAHASTASRAATETASAEAFRPCPLRRRETTGKMIG
jgi:hypothetical protein